MGLLLSTTTLVPGLERTFHGQGLGTHDALRFPALPLLILPSSSQTMAPLGQRSITRGVASLFLL
jgi:hypothetical protein